MSKQQLDRINNFKSKHKNNKMLIEDDFCGEDVETIYEEVVFLEETIESILQNLDELFKIEIKNYYAQIFKTKVYKGDVISYDGFKIDIIRFLRFYSSHDELEEIAIMGSRWGELQSSDVNKFDNMFIEFFDLSPELNHKEIIKIVKQKHIHIMRFKRNEKERNKGIRSDFLKDIKNLGAYPLEAAKSEGLKLLLRRIR